MRRKGVRPLIYEALRWGRAYTIEELSEMTETSQTSVSAQLRDMRKPKYGGHNIRRRARTEDPLTYEYYLLKEENMKTTTTTAPIRSKKGEQHSPPDVNVLDKVLSADYKEPFLSEAQRRAVEATVETGSYMGASRQTGIHFTTIRVHCLNAMKKAWWNNSGVAAQEKPYKSQRVAAQTAKELVSGISIEKGVPLLPKLHKYAGISDTLRKMEPGDSFVLERDDSNRRAYRGVHATAARLGVKITVRSQGDGTYRIWRVK